MSDVEVARSEQGKAKKSLGAILSRRFLKVPVWLWCLYGIIAVTVPPLLILMVPLHILVAGIKLLVRKVGDSRKKSTGEASVKKPKSFADRAKIVFAYYALAMILLGVFVICTTSEEDRERHRAEREAKAAKKAALEAQKAALEPPAELHTFMGFEFGEATNAELESSEINHCLWRRVKTPTRLLDLDSFDYARLHYTVQSRRLFKIIIKDEYEIDEYGLTDTEKQELESYAKTIAAIIKAKYNVSAKPADHYKIGNVKITFEHGVRVPTTYYALRALGDNSARKQYYRVVELTVEDENMSKIAEDEWKKEIADRAKRKKDEEQKKREDRVNNAKRFL